MASATDKKTGVGFGVVAMILGIVSIFGLGVFTSIPAIVFGVIAVQKYKGPGFGMGIAGIVTGAIGIISGVIFLMSFIALPSLQASQRDTARKNDVSIVVSAITQYSSNNQGTLPSDDELTSGSFSASNLDLSFEKKIVVGGKPTDDTIVFVRGVTCADGNLQTGDRYFSVRTMLENGTEYCQSN